MQTVLRSDFERLFSTSCLNELLPTVLKEVVLRKSSERLMQILLRDVIDSCVNNLLPTVLKQVVLKEVVLRKSSERLMQILLRDVI